MKSAPFAEDSKHNDTANDDEDKDSKKGTKIYCTISDAPQTKRKDNSPTNGWTYCA